jgi:hypothetical protein
LFYACILRYYLSKPLTSLSCPLNAVFPGLKMWDTFLPKRFVAGECDINADK